MGFLDFRFRGGSEGGGAVDGGCWGKLTPGEVTPSPKHTWGGGTLEFSNNNNRV